MADKRSLLPAFISHGIYYVLFIISLFTYDHSGIGVSLGFILWKVSLLIAFFAVAWHILGAILNITRGNKMPAIIYLILAILGMPLFFVVGISFSAVEIIIWNIYVGVLFSFFLFFFFRKKKRGQSE
jgi:hypothetical protein